MTGALVPAAIAVAVAANLSVWGSILYRVRHPLPEPKRAPYKPRHVATERIHAGGRYLAIQPRYDAPPLTEQPIIRQREGRPWATAGNPVARDAWPCCEHCTDGSPCDPRDSHRFPCVDGCNDPAPCTDAETLAMYRGDWGTMPAERVIAAELPQVIA